MTTSKKVAKKAGKLLERKDGTKAQKSVDGSALSQAQSRKKKSKK